MRSYVKIYQIILIITHNVFNLLCAFYDLYVRARESLSLIFSHEVRWKDAECMDNLFKRLNKTPQHLTVILGTEEPNFGDLINLIVWCTASGIPFVSFYDHNGKSTWFYITFYHVLFNNHYVLYRRVKSEGGRVLQDRKRRERSAKE